MARWILGEEIRKLRDDLHEALLARQEAALAAYNASVTAETIQKLAYAEGQRYGQQEMYDHACRIVIERTASLNELVSLEDLKEAKRGLLH